MSHMPSFGNPPENIMTRLANLTGNTLVAGTPIYMFAAGAGAPAVATAIQTAIVVGLLAEDCVPGATEQVQTAGILELSTAQWTGLTGAALTFGLPYYLDVVTGKITAFAPTTVGQFVTLLGVALSTTQLRLLIQPPIGL